LLWLLQLHSAELLLGLRGCVLFRTLLGVSGLLTSRVLENAEPDSTESPTARTCKSEEHLLRAAVRRRDLRPGARLHVGREHVDGVDERSDDRHGVSCLGAARDVRGRAEVVPVDPDVPVRGAIRVEDSLRAARIVDSSASVFGSATVGTTTSPRLATTAAWPYPASRLS
jgi:hypothetical protein